MAYRLQVVRQLHPYSPHSPLHHRRPWEDPDGISLPPVGLNLGAPVNPDTDKPLLLFVHSLKPPLPGLSQINVGVEVSGVNSKTIDSVLVNGSRCEWMGRQLLG